MALCVAIGLMSAFAPGAVADSGCAVRLAGCFAKAKKSAVHSHRVVVTVESGSRNHKALNWNRPRTNDFTSYQQSVRKGRPDGGGCAGQLGGDACVVVFSTDPAPTTRGTVVVTITPYQAALMAVAYLPLQPGKPTVGPPPKVNKWKMAAVGYPLWIWAEGNLDPAPVTHSVSGLSVSLNPSLAKIVYDMGDGTTITCGPGTPWHKGSVPAGTPSPDCGHTYTKPSLPKGSYTITATTHWSVGWTAGGQSGTIPFTQTLSTTLPVGEVQTLVR
jgi:hypothetical protein